jgi:hypothetical protein
MNGFYRRFYALCQIRCAVPDKVAEEVTEFRGPRLSSSAQIK